MDPVTVLIGAVAIGYGAFTLIGRIARPEMIAKAQPMKDRWGPRAGLALHFVAYTLVPIVFGIFALLAGLKRRSLF